VKHLIHRHTVSFRHAWDGVRYVITTQPNFRIHIALSTLAIILSYAFGISTVEKIIIVFTILLGLTCEMINTAIESVTDLIVGEWKVEAKIAKDVSAGMMLVTAIGAVVVAYIIFLPYILQALSI
jgi:diacylglycerol kinase (ATP)